MWIEPYHRYLRKKVKAKLLNKLADERLGLRLKQLEQSYNVTIERGGERSS